MNNQKDFSLKVFNEMEYELSDINKSKIDFPGLKMATKALIFNDRKFETVLWIMRTNNIVPEKVNGIAVYQLLVKEYQEKVLTLSDFLKGLFYRYYFTDTRYMETTVEQNGRDVRCRIIDNTYREDFVETMTTVILTIFKDNEKEMMYSFRALAKNDSVYVFKNKGTIRTGLTMERFKVAIDKGIRRVNGGVEDLRLLNKIVTDPTIMLAWEHSPVNRSDDKYTGGWDVKKYKEWLDSRVNIIDNEESEAKGDSGLI